jgi:hypothetical protein
MRRAGVIAVIAVCCVSLLGCAAVGTKRPSSGYGPVIRALISETRGAADVKSSGGFRIEGENGMVLLRSNDPATIEITRNRQSIQLRLEPRGSVAAADGSIYITPLKSGDLEFDGTAYPGRFLVRGSHEGGLQLINVLPLET